MSTQAGFHYKIRNVHPEKLKVDQLRPFIGPEVKKGGEKNLKAQMFLEILMIQKTTWNMLNKLILSLC